MKADNKHYKFINSQTGNAIYYHACDAKLTDEERKDELDKIKVQVAIQNGLFLESIYWQEVESEK